VIAWSGTEPDCDVQIEERDRETNREVVLYHVLAIKRTSVLVLCCVRSFVRSFAGSDPAAPSSSKQSREVRPLSKQHRSALEPCIARRKLMPGRLVSVVSSSAAASASLSQNTFQSKSENE
jgi:hypothetical protein